MENAQIENYSGLIGKYQRMVSDAKNRMAKYHKRYRKNRNAVDLSAENKCEEYEIKPYLIYTAISSLVPTLYAKNPEIEVRPSAIAVAVQGEVSPWVEFCEAAEKLLQQELVINADLKRRMKSCLFSTMTCGIGWVKITFQEDYPRDPIQDNRLPDVQDNIARIHAITRDIETGQASDADKEELEYQTQLAEDSLAGEREMFLQKGLVVDRVRPEDIFVLSDSLVDISDYTQAEAIAHRVFMTSEEFEKLFNQKPFSGRADKSPTYTKEYTDTDDELSKMVCVWEVWSKSDGLVFTFEDGADKFLREPMQPNATGERFYPFFALMFNMLDGRYHPISDVELMLDYQKEYMHLRTELYKARQRNKPTFIVPAAGDVTAPEADRIVRRVMVTGASDSDSEWFAASIDPSQNINQSIQQFQIPQVNLQLFEPSAIFRDVEMTTRSGDAARGYINKAKTATEAEIMSMGQQSASSERQDMIEDVMRDIARYALEILVQKFTPEDVARSIGSAGTWQNMSANDAYSHMNIDIRAGSMSKPNKFQEREQWMQLMPVIENSVMRMAELMAQGMGGMAMAVRKMLEETINRFDERIDLDEFIPDFSQDLMNQQMIQAQQQQMQIQPTDEEIAQQQINQTQQGAY